MANPWFRLYSEFANDPKIQMFSEADQRRFIMLLCVRCSNGDVTLQDEEVAFQMRISNEEWLRTKALFISKNLIDEDNKPIAWDKRQYSSDSSAARVAKHRENKKQQCNVTVTPPDTEQIQNRTDTDKRVEKKKNANASRLPADWNPSDVDQDFCRTERPDLVADQVAERFRDYWISQPGAKGRKLDWSATWRNWVRNEKRQAPSYQSIHDQRAETVAILTGRKQAERVITGEVLRVA